MKVGFFSFGILEQGGGFENFIVNNAAGLQKLHPDTEISVITCDDKITKRLQSLLTFYYFKKQPVESIYREDIEDIKSKLDTVRYKKISSFKALKKEFKKYDVIHTKNEILELVLLKIFGFKNLPPVITGIHTPIHYPYTPSIQSKIHNWVYSLVYSVVLKDISAVYAQNQDDYMLLKNKFNYQHASLINQAIVIKTQNQVQNKLNEIHLFFAGRLSEAKGVDILVECINILSKEKQFKNMKFRLAGSGESYLEDRLRNLSQHYDNVEYLGHIPHEQMKKHYEWADASIIPSRYETLNKIAIETGTFGKVAIVSNVPGPRQVIKNGVTGYLVDLDAEMFAEKVISVFEIKTENPEAFYDMGLEAQKYIATTFEPSYAFSRLYGLFQAAYTKV